MTSLWCCPTSSTTKAVGNSRNNPSTWSARHGGRSALSWVAGKFGQRFPLLVAGSILVDAYLSGRCPRGQHGEDAFFAASPPLEALRLLLSHVATNRDGSHGGRNVTVLDAKMAHPHAFAESEVCVELPPERWKPGFSGWLIQSFYGTSDANALWERFLAAQLAAVSFIRGKAMLLPPRVKGHPRSCPWRRPHSAKWVHKALEHRILVKATIGI